ncbi:SDR family oxidoreductase [Gulosibacter chungangensis]|uniref:SDR family oxidoreductase n=1 Tax=Gulosibacter chungangensis TaxID=979746 RepID=A0A7J5B772_9MICO|nr:SDR family oxidoreductase [Gulosibacter chungangensis]KAB1640577.1 SDR family oxidoreductase [Gulosibacter chungangensis]
MTAGEGRVAGKVAFITGAAGGIGSTTAKRLIAEGARVVATDLASKQGDLAALRESLADPSALLPVSADVSDLDSLKDAVAAGVDAFGTLDVVFANAGVLLPEDSVENIPGSTWDTVLSVNLTGVFHTAQATFPILKRNRNGSSVILASSTAGIRGGAKSSAYTATKTALVGLAETWSHELGPFGGRVNTTHPTAVGTDLVLNRENLRRFRPDLDDPTPDDVIEAFKRGKLLDIPWIDTEDVANAVLFLASDEARYITGAHLTIDAGSTVKWG